MSLSWLEHHLDMPRLSVQSLVRAHTEATNEYISQWNNISLSVSQINKLHTYVGHKTLFLNHHQRICSLRFRERGREREKHVREKHQWVASHMHRNLVWNLQPFGVRANIPTRARHKSLFCHLFCIFFKDFIYLFLERGREGEKHQCVVASEAPPTGDLAHKRHVP